MIKVDVKNKSGAIITSAVFNDTEQSDAWIAEQVSHKAFGKPERWVDAEDLATMGEDRSAAVASQQVSVGSGEDRTQYKFAAEYTVEQSEIKSLVSQDPTLQEAQAYLMSTDWYVIRFLETQKAIPAEVSQKRIFARSMISTVRGQV